MYSDFIVYSSLVGFRRFSVRLVLNIQAASYIQGRGQAPFVYYLHHQMSSLYLPLAQ